VNNKILIGKVDSPISSPKLIESFISTVAVWDRKTPSTEQDLQSSTRLCCVPDRESCSRDKTFLSHWSKYTVMRDCFYGVLSKA
jgi:hypothetical protein